MPDLAPMTYGTVRFRAADITPDSVDGDLDPEARAVTGTVTLTAAAPALLVATAVPLPATVFNTPKVATILSDTYMGINGVHDMKVPATDDPAVNPSGYTYTAVFDLRDFLGNRITYGPIEGIQVPAGQITDLTTVSPVPSYSGTPTLQGPPDRSKVWGDIFQPMSPSIAPSSKVQVSTSWPGTWDGLGPEYTALQLAGIVDYNSEGSVLSPWTGDPAFGYWIDQAGSGTAKQWDIEFILDGDYCSLETVVFTGVFGVRVFVDDEEIGEHVQNGLPVDTGRISLPGTTYWSINLNFAEWGSHKVRIVGPMLFYRLKANKNHNIRPVEKKHKVIVVSDSWWEQGTLNMDTLGMHFRTQTGFKIINHAWGGTGFANTADKYGKVERLAKLAAVIDDADLLMVNGTSNDNSIDEAVVLAERDAYFNAVQALRPDLPWFHIGLENVNWFRTTSPGEAWIKARETVFMDHSETFANTIGTYRVANDDIFTGTGYEGTPVGDGSEDYYISADTVHLSTGGTIALAAHIVNKLAVLPVKWEV